MSNNELSAMESEELLETVMIQLAQELLTAKKQGKPLSDNLRLIDRLLKYEALRQRRAALRLRERKAESKAAITRSQEIPQPRRVATTSQEKVEAQKKAEPQISPEPVPQPPLAAAPVVTPAPQPQPSEAAPVTDAQTAPTLNAAAEPKKLEEIHYLQGIMQAHYGIQPSEYSKRMFAEAEARQQRKLQQNTPASQG